MAIKVYIDRIETLEMKEKWGVLESVVRRAFVKGLVGTSWAVMYSVLEAAGIPKKGTYLDADKGVNLYVTDREVKMVDKDSAEVIIVYGHFADKGQKLFVDWATVTNRNISGKMEVSVTQKTTNMFRESGIGEQKLIDLQHTYPPDDPDYGGQTIKQTGEINVAIPQRTFSVQGCKEFRQSGPWDMADNLIGAVNNTEWMGQPKHTWMCTEVTWEYRDTQDSSFGPYRASLYFMTFTFQHNPDSWNPSVVFIDDRTNRPPEHLVEGDGYKYIRYHKEVNFKNELGFKVIGPEQR